MDLYRETVGFFGRVISPALSQGRCLHKRTQAQKKDTQASMPRVGFKPTIPVFERGLDLAATVIGRSNET
jgi:hypothetical protein